MDRILNTKGKYAFPLLHFLLSFLYERSILIFGLDRDIILSVPRNFVISDTGERILGYVLSKLFALIMIFFLWNLLFWVIRAWRTRKNLRFFLFFFLLGCAGLLLLWPEPFAASQDNFITYSYAIRFWPEYWHSAYTSCIYAAMLMVVPHPVFLTIFQWFFAIFILGYLYNRILDSPVLKGRGRFGVLLVFLMPGVYTLFTNPYRTELYALLCMFLVSKTAMDIVDQKQREIPDLLSDLLLCSFVGVWRTEGIILGVLLFALQIVFVYGYRRLRAIICFLCMLLAFGAFSVPQKLGDKKYYGKDYSFINSFPTLRNILASPDANLSYEGALEDLAAIEAVTPVEILRRYGMDGYRRYNYANGRGDINQSLADDGTAAAYMSAYYRMVAHNLPIYARTQLFMLLKSIMLKPEEYVVYDSTTPVNDLDPWKLASWDIGEEDFYAVEGVAVWKDTVLHRISSELADALGEKISGFLQKTYFYSLLLICFPLYEIYLFLAEGFRFLKKKCSRFGLAGIAFILLGQAAAICLVMPAGTLVYLHAYYYCSFILCLIYTACRHSSQIISAEARGMDNETTGEQ